jgi:hypothetical protein
MKSWPLNSYHRALKVLEALPGMKTSNPASSLARWILAATLLAGIGSFHSEGRSQEGPGPMVGKPAPAFQIQGIHGESYSIETFKGHILVMQFGSSW